MNPIVEAAFELDLAALDRRVLTGVNTVGALLAACSAHDADPRRQLKVIRRLVEAGADPEERDKNGVTPLHRAVRFRNVAAVKALIRMGVSLDAQDRKSKSTALHRAVIGTGAPGTKGKSEEAKAIIKALLRAGADPSIKNKSGKRADAYVKDPAVKNLFGGKGRKK